MGSARKVTADATLDGLGQDVTKKLVMTDATTTGSAKMEHAYVYKDGWEHIAL